MGVPVLLVLDFCLWNLCLARLGRRVDNIMEGSEAIARSEAREETAAGGKGASRILSAKTLQHGHVDTGKIYAMRLLDIYVGLHICNSIKSVVSSKDLRTGVIFCPNTGRFMERVLSGSILALCAVFSRCA